MPETADIATIDGEGIGVSPWEFDSISESSATFSLESAAAIHGDNGYRFDGTGATGRGNLLFGNNTNVYVRFYIRPVSSSLTNLQYKTTDYISDGGTDLIELRLYGGATGMGYIVYFRHNGGVIAAYNRQSNADLTYGDTFWFEFNWKQGGIGTGGYEIWLNGVSLASDYSTYDTSNYTPDYCFPGVSGGSTGATVFDIDDILISTTGPIGAYVPGETADIAVIDGEDIPFTTPWGFDFITEESGNDFSLSTAALQHGEYGYQCVFGGSNDAAWAEKTFTEQAEIYVRFYVYYPSTNYPYRTDATFRDSYCFYMRDGSTNVVILRLQSNNTGIKIFTVYYQDDSGQQSSVHSTAISQNTLHYFDIKYKSGSGDGAFEVLLDGASITSASNLTTSYLPDAIRVGHVYSGTNPASGEYYYLDDILVSSTGPIGAYHAGDDYFRLFSGGQFQDATIFSYPGEYSLMTDGLWNTVEGSYPTGGLIHIVPIIHHQHMSMGGRAA